MSRQPLPFGFYREGVITACIVFATVIAVNIVMQIGRDQTPHLSNTLGIVHTGATAQRFVRLSQSITTLEQKQRHSGITIIDPVKLEQALSLAQVSIRTGDNGEAKKQMDRLAAETTAATAKLAHATQSAPADALGPQNSALNVPILLYHHPPANFAQQLDRLQQRGYHTITPSQLVDALQQGSSLPAKPVIITFDDGFSDQLAAFHELQSRQMRATYYIITGGARSKWCIGAGRRHGDPLQPSGGCGDSYLNWDEVRMLDRSGLIAIGSHTLDHENLAADSPEEQTFQILEGKRQLEIQIGHAVSDFAYPYGAFTTATVDIVRGSGFGTAVTTNPGTTQSTDGLLTLHRVRDALTLP